MELTNSYTRLPERFYQRTAPKPVRDPSLLVFNHNLAEQLQLDTSLVDDPQRLANLFAGNELFAGSQPLALAYAGHQFGGFSPQLGDGRAHLLGELHDAQGHAFELQLKGSGPTAFSRGGDGRSALGPALREYIMSEAMHGLKIKTTRSLAVVATGETVRRETPLPGGIVARTARSHLRVGTFQFFAVRRDTDGLRALADYAIARLYPHLQNRQDPYLDLLDAVISAQVELVTEWMRVGFIHGVMNTDNTTISGETIDFGPCAMMSAYDPATVFSSIDHRGRYAFGNQPAIIAWNMARLAETLLPLLDDDEQAAITRAQACISEVPERLDTAWQNMMARKLGLPGANADDDRQLVADLLTHMRQEKLDYTNTFDALTESLTGAHPPDSLTVDWLANWHQRLQTHGLSETTAKSRMRAHNPRVIPRNHHVEAMLDHTVQTRDTERLKTFLRVLHSPYEQTEHTPQFSDPPTDGDKNYMTFCGT